MKIQIKLIKAFTQDKEQGNPAGVILDASDLSDQQMQKIALKYNFSECVFIQKSNKADVMTRFFSPTQEVDFCGHATIAAFKTIINSENTQFLENKTFVQETRKGIFNIQCMDNGLIIMELANPNIINFVIDDADIAKLLNIPQENILNDSMIISTGTPKLITHIKSLDALLKIKPNLEGIKEYCLLSGARGFYPFTTETISIDSDFHARQFNPLAGIDEDPVTGIAAGALSVYLKEKNILSKRAFVVEQGYIMNKFGKIHVSANERITIGGHAIEFGIEEIDI